MSNESVHLNRDSSSCFLFSYKNDTYIMQLGKELKELMQNDIEMILKQEGVVYKHVPLPLTEVKREHAGETKRSPGIQRQIFTKNDGPVRINKKTATSDVENDQNIEQKPKKLNTIHHQDSSVNLETQHENKVVEKDCGELDNLATSSVQTESKTNLEIREEIPRTASLHDNNMQSEERNYTESEDSISKVSHGCHFCCNALSPKSGREVAAEIRRLTSKYLSQNILLAVVSEPKYYHMNVLSISTGECLGCIMATQSGFMHADTQLKLADFRTFYISPHTMGNAKEHVKNIDAYFQYMRQANKKKRLRDAMNNKQTYSFVCGKK